MADEAKSTDLPESEKSSQSAQADEVAQSKAASEAGNGLSASQAKGDDQIQGFKSLADAQQQRYLQRALNRSTQSNISKFTAHRLEAVASPSQEDGVSNEVPKSEQTKEVFDKTRRIERSTPLGPSQSALGIAALVCIIGVACGLLFFAQPKGEDSNKSAALSSQPGKAKSTGGGNNNNEAEVTSATALGAFYLNRAQNNIHSGQYAEALVNLKTASIKDPSKKAICTQKIADLVAKSKGDKGVLATTEALLALQPDNITALLLHAQASYRIGNKLSARQDFFKATQLAPNDAHAYLARGDYYSAEKDFTSAELDFKKALALDPKISGAKQKLAAASASLKKAHSQALAKSQVVQDVKEQEQSDFSVAEVQQLKSTDLSGLREAGRQALSRHHVSFAVAALSRCVVINPNDAQSRKLLAYALINACEAGAAFDQYNAWASLTLVGLDEQLAFGRALAKAGDIRTTIAFFDFLVDEHYNDAQALLRVAQMADKVSSGCEPVDRAVNLGLKLSSGNLRNQFSCFHGTSAKSQSR